MPRYIAKLAEDKYMEWSTVVDAPVTNIMTRSEMSDYLIIEQRQPAGEVADRMERTDTNGTSAMSKLTMERLIAGNRAGEGETELTLEQILEEYK